MTSSAISGPSEFKAIPISSASAQPRVANPAHERVPHLLRQFRNTKRNWGLSCGKGGESLFRQAVPVKAKLKLKVYTRDGSRQMGRYLKVVEERSGDVWWGGRDGELGSGMCEACARETGREFTDAQKELAERRARDILKSPSSVRWQGSDVVIQRRRDNSRWSRGIALQIDRMKGAHEGSLLTPVNLFHPGLIPSNQREYWLACVVATVCVVLRARDKERVRSAFLEFATDCRRKQTLVTEDICAVGASGHCSSDAKVRTDKLEVRCL